MVSRQKYLDKIDEMIALAESVIQEKDKDLKPREVSPLISAEFISSATTFILSIYGKDSPFYKNFVYETMQRGRWAFKAAIGILTAVRKHIQQGWLERYRDVRTYNALKTICRERAPQWDSICVRITTICYPVSIAVTGTAGSLGGFSQNCKILEIQE